MASKNRDEERVRQLEQTNEQLLAALAECHEKLNHLEHLLKASGQDSPPPELGTAAHAIR